MNKKILIGGDSWGCGEWIPGAGHAVHKGLEQYFLDEGFTVVNVSRGGQTNEETLEKIKKIDYKSFDYIFIFVTDTARTITQELAYPKRFWKNYPSVKDIIKRDRKILKHFYNNLNKLNTTINLLGGLTHINVKHLRGLTNIQCPIPSIQKFLIPDKRFKFAEMHFTGASSFMPRTIHKETFDWVSEQVYRWHGVGDTEYFKLDHVHPDRRAHWLIFQHLMDTLEINK